MVIFHSYVSLPKGIYPPRNQRICWMLWSCWTCPDFFLGCWSLEPPSVMRKSLTSMAFFQPFQPHQVVHFILWTQVLEIDPRLGPVVVAPRVAAFWDIWHAVRISRKVIPNLSEWTMGSCFFGACFWGILTCHVAILAGRVRELGVKIARNEKAGPCWAGIDVDFKPSSGSERKFWDGSAGSWVSPGYDLRWEMSMIWVCLKMLCTPTANG